MICEFRRVSLLPPELRTKIWDLATRPAGFRGVQYFSILPLHRPPERFQHHVSNRLRPQQSFLLGPPMPTNETAQPSWNNSESTYAIDSGLWTACKESRAAMYRCYRPEERSDFLQQLKEKPHLRWDIVYWRNPKHFDTSATFMVNDMHTNRFVTVLPAQDLIFIQPYDRPFNPACIYDSMPFAAGDAAGFGELSNVALEFDPSWNVMELREYQRQWKAAVLDDEACLARFPDRPRTYERYDTYDQLVTVSQRSWTQSTNFWLVDRRLRRKRSSPAHEHLEKAQIVFHGNDCRFFAMPEGREDQFCYYPPTKNQNLETIWDFTLELDRVGSEQVIVQVEEGICGMAIEPKIFEGVDTGYVNRWRVLVQESNS
ncbi:hypothetical protein CCHR01_12098 [Colletotrichum chrysophilum]|uniref:2EXR domain-containing protein n=1 Tax=Colletotrichum chrysophilum TaxID=1836956 RepID=A0AAD9EE50_9PEZI|nr:hypothetical protein CCHR01_12098 [Colletotrichum chrysophilum]